ASAARAMHREAPAGSPLGRTRWLGAPAVLIVAVAAWPAIERDWLVIWTMWGLLLAMLTLMLAVTARGLRGPTALPPVWFLFGVSFVTAVVAWSPRDLRVEWFSLPLGLFLLAAGALALHRPPVRPGRATLESWPAGWTGSWALLAPGLITMLSASVAATYTDPRTWRAILVMVIALVAILVGATRRLAAPFLIGIVVLPVENLLAFMVQIGRGIEAMPWWITLSVVGAVLLIIAVGYERQAGDGTGIAARLRDLA
ncbi:SCO7613 C-terminal domain-containing membrane protein, partial [Microbacterium arthrosphaerae]